MVLLLSVVPYVVPSVVAAVARVWRHSDMNTVVALPSGRWWFVCATVCLKACCTVVYGWASQTAGVQPIRSLSACAAGMFLVQVGGLFL